MSLLEHARGLCDLCIASPVYAEANCPVGDLQCYYRLVYQSMCMQPPPAVTCVDCTICRAFATTICAFGDWICVFKETFNCICM